MFYDETQLKQLTELLGSGGGAVLIAAAFALLIASITIPALRWPFLILLPFVASLGGHDDKPLAWPLQDIGRYGRAICVILLTVLFLASLRGHRWRPNTMLPVVMAFAAYEIVCTLCTLRTGHASRGFFGTIVFTLIFVALGLGLGRCIQTLRDAERSLLCLIIAGLMTCLTSVVQVVIDPSTVIENNRLKGITGNANQMASLLAMAILPHLYFLLRKGTTRLSRILLVGSIGLAVVLLIWTGSRTGVMMFLVGFVVMFRNRLRSAILVIISVFIVVLALWQLLDVGGDTALRIVSTDNTRAVAWTTLVQDFAESPLFGVTRNTSSENSYLLVAARAGLVGLLPLAFALLLLANTLGRISSLRPSLGPAAELVDVVLAGCVALLVGAFFEGFLYGTLTYPVMALYVYFAISGFLVDYGAAHPQGELPATVPVDPDLMIYDAPLLGLPAHQYKRSDLHPLERGL